MWYKETRTETYNEIMNKDPVFPSKMTGTCRDFIAMALAKVCNPVFADSVLLLVIGCIWEYNGFWLCWPEQS